MAGQQDSKAQAPEETASSEAVVGEAQEPAEEKDDVNENHEQNVPPPSKRRRSPRNTNRLLLPNKSSLEYRRLESLFFHEEEEGTRQQFGNLTLERLHQSPNIYSVDKFLNESELQYFMQKIAKGGFQRSYVDAIHCSREEEEDDEDKNDGGKENGKCDRHKPQQQQESKFDNQHRTSTFLSFQKQQDSMISNIEQRAATLMGCWSPGTSIEPLQLVRYQPGQFFGVHHDLGDYNDDTGEVALPPKQWCVKRRIATIFVYLNDLPRGAGGETSFPEASELAVTPQRGRAVVFANVLANGMPDPRTVHAGTTVTKGTKYGLNIWICES